MVRVSVLAIIGISATTAMFQDETPKSFTKHRLVFAQLPSLWTFNVARSLNENGLLELWHDLPREGSILFSVAPEHFPEVQSTFNKSNCVLKVIEDDLQKVIDEERTGLTYALGTPRSLNLRQFESYDQIDASISHYVNEAGFLGHINRFVTGKTSQGREIVGIKISNSIEKKPIIFLECGIHAREWASTSSCLYIIDELVRNQNTHKDLLDRFEFHIIPSVNPDGYEYTRIQNRLWRKNRNPKKSNFLYRCLGVDLNRNFKSGPHCGVGTEKNPCSDIYCGSNAFSEPETAALRDYLTGIKDDVEYYVAVHAFGLMWMFPYSYTTDHCPDHDDLMRRSKIAVDTIKATTGTQYKYGPTAETIYAVTGSSVDWAYMELGIKKSYVLEVQPSLNAAFGGRGFLLPADQIIAVGNETFIGLKAMWLS